MKRVMFLISLCMVATLWGLEPIAIVKSTTGEVNIKRYNRVIRAKVGTELQKGDIIITKYKSAVGIMFDDGSRLSLGENSIFNINKFLFKPNQNRFDIDLKLIKGKALFNSGKVGKIAPKAVKFRVPEGIIGIRGTEFLVEVR